MATRVILTFNDFDKLFKEMRTKILTESKRLLERKIISTMKKGKSPVKGGRWDTPYSKSYQNAMRTSSILKALGKKKSPVNLKLSGQLHESLDIDIKKNALVIEFDDDLAEIHNKLGAGKAKAIRRMLPTNPGEKFNTDITKDLDKIFNKASDAFTKKANL